MAAGLPVQRSAAAVKEGPLITKEGLKANDFVFVAVAKGGNAPALANTTTTMTVRVLRKEDVAYKTAIMIENSLIKPKRNGTSGQPVHGNMESRLPTYPPILGMQPYPEYLCDFGGGARLVVDVVAGKVYLSGHYGDASAKAGTIPEDLEGVSAHVLLDSSWNTSKIVGDAKAWWKDIVKAAQE